MSAPKQFLRAENGAFKRIQIRALVIKAERGTRARIEAEFSQQRLRAVIARPDRDLGLIEDRAQIMRMDAIDGEGQHARPLRSGTDQMHAWNAGQHLDAGAAFAQVLDLDAAEIQIAVPERDAAMIAPGQAAAVKLDSYPQRTWRSPVAAVSPEAVAGDGDRTFTVEVPVANADATLRAGMSGQAKIFIGWRPAGYVLLRAPALWLWQTVWNWIGW